MTKKRRSETFYERKSQEYHINKDRVKSNRRKRKKPRRKLPRLLLIMCGVLLAVIIYLKYVANPEYAINKAVISIKTGNLNKQEEVFERLSDINKILSISYSDDEKEKEDFLKANYSNLEVKIKSQEKTQKGLMVDVEVSNIDFIEVFDSIKKDNPNFHRDYMDALEKESQHKNKGEARLLLKRKLIGYKIYESHEFVNAILGGALENK